jgi:hypothetical protein
MHDFECEEGGLLNEKREPFAVNLSNAAVRVGDGRSTPRPIVNQGHLAEDFAGAQRAHVPPVGIDIHLAVQYYVHTDALVTLPEDDVTGIEYGDVPLVLEQFQAVVQDIGPRLLEANRFPSESAGRRGIVDGAAINHIKRCRLIVGHSNANHAAARSPRRINRFEEDVIDASVTPTVAIGSDLRGCGSDTPAVRAS